MPGFNPLDHPICLSNPLRLVPTSSAAYVPFAMYLVEALRPRVILELGTASGVLYCAFCQTVKELRLDTRCYAVSTGASDLQSESSNAAEILQDLQAHHDPLYGEFSSLIQSPVDEAISNFADGTIDLLRLNGYRTYDTVKRDFENLLPKLSERGVILLHQINTSGVGKLWQELRSRYPSFEFAHEAGLGLISPGPRMAEPLNNLLTASQHEQSTIREFFSQLGQHLEARLDNEQQIKTLSAALNDSNQIINSLSDESRSLRTTAEARLNAHEKTIEALSAELTSIENRLDAILNSRAWRWVSRYGRARIRYFEPAYQTLLHPFRHSLRGRPEEHGSENGQHSTKPKPPAAPVPKVRPTDEASESLVLLPEPNPKQILSLLAEQHPVAEQYPIPAQSSSAQYRKPDVICFSIIDWDFRYQRPQQIMSRFAAHGHRVFYIKLKRVLPAETVPPFSIRELKQNVYEVTLAATREPLINRGIIKGANAASLLGSLNAFRRACHINEAIGYVMTPSWTSVALSTKTQWGWRIIYDCMDEWEGFPGVAQAVIKVERELVRECDLLLVTATKLFEKWRERERPLTLVRNGVDFEFYAERYQPNTLIDAEARPIIGYYGAIAEWFDLELMAYVARQRPDYLFVLLGGIFDVNVSELKSLPNVRLLGQQPYEMMPLYLYHFAACVIPFRINAVTHATDPVKLYEYLSAGKPVVAVALSEIEHFRDYLYVAESREDFITKLDSAVAEDDRELTERRREFAQQNSWRERYASIATALSATIPRASIIIVTYNNLALNKLCIASILRNTEYPNYEVIVVDNNSSDGTQHYLRGMGARHSHLHVILNPDNHGFARAINQGVAISTGEDLVFLNNDTVVPSGWLSRLLRHLDDPQVGMVGPVTNFAGNEAKIEVAYETWSELESFADDYVWEHDGEIADITMLAMFCVALRRKTFAAIGPLDEQFGIGMFEDDDYARRLQAAGLRVICAADVFVHHFGQAAFKQLIERGEYAGLFDENRRRFETKWSTRWRPHQNGQLKFQRKPQ